MQGKSIQTIYTGYFQNLSLPTTHITISSPDSDQSCLRLWAYEGAASVAHFQLALRDQCLKQLAHRMAG